MSVLPKIYVVDDDVAFGDSLCTLLESHGHVTERYESPNVFLDRYDSTAPGCLVLDLRMPEMSGTALQEALNERGIDIPIVMVSAQPGVEAAVRAMKNGAIDFITKPCDTIVLMDRIRQAIDLDKKNRALRVRCAQAEAHFALLTPREADIAVLMMDGQPPKQIAYALGISRKTVDVHVGHIRLKLGVFSSVDLIRMFEPLDLSGRCRAL